MFENVFEAFSLPWLNSASKLITGLVVDCAFWAEFNKVTDSTE